MLETNPFLEVLLYAFAIEDICFGFCSNELSFTSNFDDFVFVETLIESFNNQEVVQEFYIVGNFGEKQRQELINIKEGLKEFKELIFKSGGLVDKTNEFVEKARSLNENGK